MDNFIKYIDAKYIGPTCVSFDHGKTYKAVGYYALEDLVSIVDESNENYIYSPKAFEFKENYTDLPEKFPDVYQNNGTLEYME